MAYTTFPKIQRSMTTTAKDYDILNDDADLLAQLRLLNPDFPTTSIPMNLGVFLPSGTPCQIKINGGEWQDFLADVAYDLDGITNVKSAVLSATACVYTVSISFE